MTTTTCLWGLLFRERGLNPPKPMLILLCHSCCATHGCASSKPRGFPGSSTWKGRHPSASVNIVRMIVFLRHLFGWILSTFGSRKNLALENLALRQQLLALHSKRPRRRFSMTQKLFWVVLRRFWSGWQKPLVLVTPRTVIEWHRAGFRLYWKYLSRARRLAGRKPLAKEIRALIFRMAAENPTWGAPRIHGELLKLGFKVSEPTVSRWLQRVPRSPDLAKRWLTFLRNHREAIAAMDFFTVVVPQNLARQGKRFCLA
jgi:hypothetical protein